MIYPLPLQIDEFDNVTIQVHLNALNHRTTIIAIPPQDLEGTDI